MTALTDMFTGLTRKFLAKWGNSALIPKQRLPLPVPVVKQLLDTPSGTKVGNWVVDRSSRKWLSVAALMAVQSNTGMRKSEVTLPQWEEAWHPGLLNWGAVTWIVGGVHKHHLTPQELQNLTQADFVVLKPPPSKADPFLQVWGAKPIYIAYSPQKGLNMAYWLAQLEYWFPVKPEQRSSSPVFVDDGGKCLRAEWWSRCLQNLLRTVMSAADAKKYSTHSFRIMLACGAWANNQSAATIQALCRWRSLDSLRIYVKMDPAHYSTLVSSALAQNIDPSHTHYLPTLDPARLVAQLDEFPR